MARSDRDLRFCEVVTASGTLAYPIAAVSSNEPQLSSRDAACDATRDAATSVGTMGHAPSDRPPEVVECSTSSPVQCADPAPTASSVPTWDAGSMKAIYAEARRIAHSILKRSPNPTWGTTILVNETFMRLLGGDWALRLQTEPNTIIPILRRVMTNALTDHHRKSISAKRPTGQGRARVYYDDALTAFDDDPDGFLDVLGLLEQLRAGAVTTLRVADPRRFAEALELSFILGCSDREVSRHLGIPQTTVSRWLRLGKAWLNRALQPDSHG